MLKKQLKNVLWKYWMLRGMRSIKNPNVSTGKIRRALKETIYNTIDSEEKAWVARIEQIRKQFADNPTPVSIVDFGAGEPCSRRSEKEMEQGAIHSTTFGEICNGSKPALWALLLFKLTKAFRPETVIELGTCIGISAAYQSAALQLNEKGRLITIEGSDAIADLAKQNIESLRLDNATVVCGKFKDVLPEILKENQPADSVFIDGHHDEHATWDYYQMLLPYLSSGALLIFDDISWSEGMRRVWKKIRKDKHIAAAIDLKMLGICLLV
jgi:predicted O-methyltransferase YrrM